MARLRRIFLIFPFLCLLTSDETVFIRILFIMLVPDTTVRNGLNKQKASDDYC